MKGFTIYINDKKVNIAIKHGVSMIIVDQTCDCQFYMSICKNSRVKFDGSHITIT